MHEHAQAGNYPKVVVEALGDGLCRTVIRRAFGCRWEPHYVMLSTGMTQPRPLILLLEDDAASAEAMELVLRDWGADVVHGARCRRRLRRRWRARARDATMIITDFHLGPKANGVSRRAATAFVRAAARVFWCCRVAVGGDGKARGRRRPDTRSCANPRRRASIIAWLEQQLARAEFVLPGLQPRATTRAWSGDDAKTRFLTAISHDMRQPLHALLLYLGALDRRVHDAEARDVLGKADRAAQSLADMFEILIWLARTRSREDRPGYRLPSR